MTERDDLSGERLEHELRLLAKERAREADLWWDAAGGNDPASLPAGSPGIDALRPIDELERARMAKSLFPEHAEPAQPARLAKRRWLWIAGTAATALAAGVAGIALRTPEEHLGAYAMTVRGGDRSWRSDEAPAADVPRYQNGSRMEIVLQPERALDVAPEIIAEVIGARTVAWPTAIERGRGGTFRLVAEIGTELVLDRGVWTLSIRVGRGQSGQRLEYRFEVADGA